MCTIKIKAFEFGFDLVFANGGNHNNITIPEKTIYKQTNLALSDKIQSSS